MGGYYLMCIEFWSDKMKVFWKWIVVMVAH